MYFCQPCCFALLHFGLMLGTGALRIFFYIYLPQVFLEPLAQVVGSSRSKSLLLEACSVQTPGSSASSSMRQMELARLGCMLGIQEWTRPLTDTFTFPQECVTVVAPQAPAPRDELLGDDEEEEEEDEVSVCASWDPLWVSSLLFSVLSVCLSCLPLSCTCSLFLCVSVSLFLSFSVSLSASLTVSLSASL